MKPRGFIFWLLCCPIWGASAAPVPFDAYARLFVGMPETDVLALAGPPDFSADGGAADLPPAARALAGSAAVRQYGWRADADTPYTTIVSVSGGVVVSIQRESDF